MNHSLFSEKMKLADLLLTNYRLLYVLPCFGIGLGTGEKTVGTVCKEKNIPAALFLLVCNIYTFDDYRPGITTLSQIPLSDLMRYLQASHTDYLENRMPKIITQIYDFIERFHMQHGAMLKEFCNRYKQEVITHFSYEEEVVFPYINALLSGGKPIGYQIKDYEGNHTDLDAALNDLKNILIKYLPGECDIEKCREIILELFLFESDLSKHTLLEDHILISLVERMEKEAL